MNKRVLCVLLLILSIGFCSCGKASEEKENSTEKVLTIQTPYANICVPESFDGTVSHEVTSKDPYTLTFKANDGTELFTLIFNGTGDVLMGTLVCETENTVIYMNVPTIDEVNENYETYCAYQNAVNTISQHLEKDYDFHIDEIVTDIATMDVEGTPVPIKYPAKWKDAVQYEVTKDRVKFSNNGTPLFDLVFADCDGFLLGTYKDIPIYIIDYKVATDEQLAMQEDVNVILQNLKNDSNFKINS